MKKTLLSFLVFLCTVSGFAATLTWNGGGTNNNWTNSQNWGGATPVAGDQLVFRGTVRTSPVNDFPAGTSFASIKLTGPAANFTLSGNAIVLSGGATAIVNNANGFTLSIANDISFSTVAPSIVLSSNANNKIVLNGAIANGGFDLTVNNYSTTENVTINGIVSGAGGVIKDNTGILALNGLNTYQGLTTVVVGTLKLGSASALGVSAMGGTSTPTVVNAGAVIDLNGQNYTTPERITINTTASGAMINSSTTAATFAGELLLGSDSYVNASVGDINIPDNGYNIAGPLPLTDSPNLTLGGAANGMIGAVVATNAGGLTKKGTGSWTFYRKTAYTGATVIMAGSLILKSADNRTVSYDIASGAVLEYNTSGIGNTNSFRSTTYTGDGVLLKTGPDVITWIVSGSVFALSANARIDIQAGSYVCGSSNVWTTNLSDMNIVAGASFNTGINSEAYIDVLSGAGNLLVGSTAGVGKVFMGANNGSGVFSGIISNYSGAKIGSIEKIGTGTQTLSGANSYTGTTTITNGQIKLGVSEVIPNISALTIAAAGVLNLNSFNETVGSIAGAGFIDNLTGAGSPIFKFGVNNQTTAFSGVMKNTTGVMNVTKTGTGTIYLDGDNTYYGQTYVEDGFVNVRNGTIISN